MRNRSHKLLLAGLLAVCVTAGWYLRQRSQTKLSHPPDLRSNVASPALPMIGPFGPETIPDLIPVNDAQGQLLYYFDTTAGVYSSTEGFRYPFLRTVRLPARTEQVSVKISLTQSKALSVRVYRDAEGELVRAEYAQKGEYTWDWLPESMESSHQANGESLKRLPAHLQSLSLQEVVDKLNVCVPLADARQWAITAVQLDRRLGFDPISVITENVYEAQVFGVSTAGGAIPNEERFKKVRYLLRLDGELIQSDNKL